MIMRRLSQVSQVAMIVYYFVIGTLTTMDVTTFAFTTTSSSPHNRQQKVVQKKMADTTPITSGPDSETWGAIASVGIAAIALALKDANTSTNIRRYWEDTFERAESEPIINFDEDDKPIQLMSKERELEILKAQQQEEITLLKQVEEREMEILKSQEELTTMVKNVADSLLLQDDTVAKLSVEYTVPVSNNLVALAMKNKNKKKSSSKLKKVLMPWA